MPRFFIDLNLDQVISKINSLRKNYDIKKLFYMMPDGKESMKLRRSVFCDVKKDEVFDFFSEISDEIKNIRDLIEKSDESDFAPRKKVLKVRAYAAYICVIKKLAEFDTQVFDAGIFSEIFDGIKKEKNSQNFLDFSNEIESLCSKLDSISYNLQFEREHYYVKASDSTSKSEAQSNIMDELRRAFPGLKDTGFISPFAGRKDPGYIETESYQAMKRQNGDVFAACSEAAEKYEDMIYDCVFDFENELQFFLSFRIFEKYMEENGFTFSTPTDSDHISADGIYDTALALSLFNQERQVIDNEVTMEKDEEFLVVTGPNQGGKTTFARAVGQLLYFYLMGLDVPASRAGLPYYDNILTHFSVEESTETGQGKLKEELTRLAPMLSENCSNSFVILNELFTTAATLDAEEMGTKVMKAFVSKGCRGIYVTHIKELTETEHSVSMVAMCDENDHHKRLYKIVRKPAEGLGYAGAIVEKYKLTYDGLMDSFKEKGLL